MITNTRLLELRATGLACERKVVLGGATHLEKEYAALFHMINNLNFNGMVVDETIVGVDEDGFAALILLRGK